MTQATPADMTATISYFGTTHYLYKGIRIKPQATSYYFHVGQIHTSNLYYVNTLEEAAATIDAALAQVA
jgi:hypothetical protein